MIHNGCSPIRDDVAHANAALPLLSSKHILDSARSTLTQEKEALAALIDGVDDAFVQAVRYILATRGCVIVSGMGKSGHIARKIAATFAATGTPSWFIHPAETSHGDMGCLTPHDVLVILSNSGETEEIRDLLDYAKQHAIPVIGMVRSARSLLAEASNVVLLVPNVPEVRAIYPTPTCSAVMMLALGDALALATLECRGLSSAMLERLHPGGKLGARFTRVGDLMSHGNSLPVCAPGTLMREAIVTMTAGCLGCVVVTNPQRHIMGVVTDGDLRRHLAFGALDEPLDTFMTHHPIVISPSLLASDALSLMEEHRITVLLVVDPEPILVGIVHIHALLRYRQAEENKHLSS